MVVVCSGWLESGTCTYSGEGLGCCLLCTGCGDTDSFNMIHDVEYP